MTKEKHSKLTLGPLFFNWEAEKRRDFYFRMADEAPIDEVYLGEVVCSKREPFFEPFLDEVINRFKAAKKKIIFSSLAIITLPRERAALEEKTKGSFLIEANDVAAVQLLQDKPFIIGPYITILNEGALGYLAKQGAKRIVFAAEVAGKDMISLAAQFPKMETEVQVFGKQPLAISMRCSHARAYGRDKDHCRKACSRDEDGLIVQTLDKEDLWAISGTQTLSAGTLLLAEEALALQTSKITHFRLSPQDMDMVQISRLYRDLLDARITPDSLRSTLKDMDKSTSFINGFFHGKEGRFFVPSSKQEAI